MKRIYLDFAASTPVDGRVLKEMYRVERGIFANPSALHKEGVFARKMIDNARREIAGSISAHPDEIIFVSSGTEANNLALLGLAQAAQTATVSAGQSVSGESKLNSKQNHCIVSAIEHPSVLECVKQLESYGFSVDSLPVDEEGVVNPKELKKILRPETLFVSVMYANNEIGTVEPIREIMKVVRKFRKENRTVFPYVHTDACQATNYLDINVLRLGVDLMTFNSSKIYGPKGVAALFKRRGVEVKPIIYGGGQENGLRSATEDTARIIGFAEALKITDEMKERESLRLTRLRDHFVERVEKEIPNAILNGSISVRLPNNVNFSFPEKDAEEIVLRLDANGVSASTRSACANQSDTSGNEASGGSYVVRALGESAAVSASSVRFTLGRQTTKKEIDTAVEVLKEIIERF